MARKFDFFLLAFIALGVLRTCAIATFHHSALFYHFHSLTPTDASFMCRTTTPDLFLFTAAKNYGHKLYITNENKERLGLIVDHF